MRILVTGVSEGYLDCFRHPCRCLLLANQSADAHVAFNQFLNYFGPHLACTAADFRFARHPPRMANSRRLSDPSPSRNRPRDNCHVELLYRRGTHRERSVFYR